MYYLLGVIVRGATNTEELLLLGGLLSVGGLMVARGAGRAAALAGRRARARRTAAPAHLFLLAALGARAQRQLRRQLLLTYPAILITLTLLTQTKYICYRVNQY